MGNTKATMVGLNVQEGVIDDQDNVRIILANNANEYIAYMDMTPSAARRVALRILQTCELAEGRPPVNS